MISVVTQVELEGGVYRSPQDVTVRRQRADLLMNRLTVLACDSTCAAMYGRIVEAAGYSRRKLLDRMIAAQALVHDATLVTRNPADFRDVPGLQLLEL